MRAVLLLTLWKLKNSLRTLFTDPRKLIPLLIAVFFVGFSLFMSTWAGANRPSSRSTLGTLSPQLFEAGIPLLLVLIVGAIFHYGLGEGLLAFGRADVDYLFSSPVSRRVVLAYRLPGLVLGVLFQTVVMLFALRAGLMSTLRIRPDALGATVAPPWVMPLTIGLCVLVYLNLALFLAVRFPRRQAARNLVLAGVAVFGALVAYVAWQRQLPGLVELAHAPWLRALFWPVALASDVLVATFVQRPIGNGLGWLAALYLLSLVPMFVTNANWYEQSIVSTERFATLRQAAQGGGLAGVMAARAANFRHRSTKEYTVRPFGQGAVALLWAHLCSAVKRPTMNFIVPAISGCAAGILGVVLNQALMGIGYVVLGSALIYATFGFMAAARTACEAAVRRRDLVAPLPIPGWQAVAADLSVPALSMALCGGGAALAYSLGGGARWPLVAVAAAGLYVLRTAARMTLQYILVLGYPDFADKLQQMLSQFVYWLFAAPLVLFEAICCIPAIVLQSYWVGVGTLIVVQLGFLALLLPLAGKASERAIASGEPVRFLSLLRKSRPT
jgi:hypothetical protein